MFDFLFDGIAGLLSFFFDLTGSIGLAIILLTVTLVGLTAPLTMKGTRSMMRMQRLQPEIKKIQTEFKDDRERMNQELLAFYQRENLNPFGACLPLLLQFPIFIVLFQVLRGLGRINSEGVADPKYLDQASALYTKIVDAGGELMSFGFDLADAATSSHASIVAALPYYSLIVAMAGTSWFQQKQAMGRRDPNTPITQQQLITQRLMIFFLPLISLSIPAGVVVYWVVSNILRIGQQWLIHYLDSREQERNGSKPVTGSSKGVIETTGSEGSSKRSGKSPTAKDGAGKGKGKGGKAKGTGPKGGSSNGSSGAGTTKSNGSGRAQQPGTRPHPRSKKKKKKRR